VGRHFAKTEQSHVLPEVMISGMDTVLACMYGAHAPHHLDCPILLMGAIVLHTQGALDLMLVLCFLSYHP
jgi:hypothetical protein